MSISVLHETHKMERKWNFLANYHFIQPLQSSRINIPKKNYWRSNNDKYFSDKEHSNVVECIAKYR